MASIEGHRVAMARRRRAPRVRPLHRGVLIGAAVLLGASLSPVGIAARASEKEATWTKAAALFHHHAPQIAPTCAGDTLVAGVHVVDCAGLVHSFDGLSLSVVVWMPKEATVPLPTLVYLHGFGSNRGEFSSTVSGHAPPFIAQSLAARGYAVVTPAARGMGGSCGMAPNTGPHDTDGRPQLEVPHGPNDDFTCSRGYSHLNDREFETRDVQHLLGVLVDAGVADAERLLATGYSYGAAQTWLLATAEPWATPDGTQIQLAAAVPIAGGTSSLNTFAPNGRASDDTDGGRSLERPHGVPKLNTILGLATASRASLGLPRFNDSDPGEADSHGTTWGAFWLKGEPFDTPEGEELVRMFRERKSAYPPDDYVAALRTGAAGPVAVLAVQGWNDALFTPLETLLMYRTLKTAEPTYPISMIFADVGHATGRGLGEPGVHAFWTGRAIEFLDAYAFGAGTEPTSEDVVSMSTECAPPLGFDVPASETTTAPDWDSLHPRIVTLRAKGSLVTDSAPPSIDEPTSDPAYPISEGGPAGCITQLAGTYDDTDAITWPVPKGGITLLGLPKLIADYDLRGEDATVVVKLWDLAPGGTRTLVTRGVYRLAVGRGGDEPAGVLKMQLFGNHYRFTEGHVIQLDVAQTDVPFLQPDRFESRIAYSNIKLELPTPAARRSRAVTARAAESQNSRAR